MIDHIPSCASYDHPNKCPANKTMFKEGPEVHWWSGWPGAYCMKCGIEDPNEICFADSCKCPCHDEMWAEYNKMCEDHDSDLKSVKD
jgi:hypothetical protein